VVFDSFVGLFDKSLDLLVNDFLSVRLQLNQQAEQPNEIKNSSNRLDRDVSPFTFNHIYEMSDHELGHYFDHHFCSEVFSRIFHCQKAH